LDEQLRGNESNLNSKFGSNDSQDAGESARSCPYRQGHSHEKAQKAQIKCAKVLFDLLFVLLVPFCG
jgi:hypothetical protein